ncbi:class I SAM-dependent methyltransferase [Peribacillus glennii]|uniref:Class I SAM-dependent methyltransferase n=1 Tax=Peribacillus glennii TaxID=2303991 RepID=A0A372LA09_9BACI|nr:class I SAM-dependent methyltransferase [Peribacillus glennii]RFU62452.1 class I SAM-dependent methyltransferase [Peribacillus glennii]
MKFSYQDALAFYRIQGAHPGGFALTKLILEREDIDCQTKILDAGCGTGQTSAYLAKTFGCKVYAIDVHPEMIKAAAVRFTEENIPVTISEGSIEELPFPEDTFDYIIAESSTAFTDITNSIQEYFRVLKPGGVLLNIDMAVEQELKSEEKAEIIAFYEMKDVWTEDEWIDAFDHAGFEAVDVLKANSVMEELEELMFEENEMSEEMPPMYDNDPEIDTVFQTHHQLLLTYGEKLGYRVFRANK